MSKTRRWLLLGGVLLIAAVVAVTLMLMNGTTEEVRVVEMLYTFEGKYADAPGFAEGTVTVTPAEEDAAREGYYLLYFADDHGLLVGYDEFASIPITGGTVTHTVKQGTLLPVGAAKLVVFESESPFLDTQPDYADRKGVFVIPDSKRLSPGDAEFTFAAISDVHMNYEAHGRGAYQKWENALNLFAEEGMDKVMVAGDMTGDEFEGTLKAQYEKYLSLIDSSDYPLEDIHECIGNHGNTEVGRRQFVYYTSGNDEQRPFEGSAWFSLLIEGEDGTRDNLFLFMAQELSEPGVSAKCDNFSEEQIDWLEEMLQTYSGTDTNIFLFEHSPFLNYGPGDRQGGSYTSMTMFKPYFFQNMRLKTLLETYKEIIVMSGHTHLSLYDGENFSDENGTSCRMIHLSSGCHPKTYNTPDGKFLQGDGRHEVNADYGSEAYTVYVYRDCILYIGRNLSTGNVIPSASYILPTVID